MNNRNVADKARSRARSLAIVLRDFSLRLEVSVPTRRACRKLMREQAVLCLPSSGKNSIPAIG